MAEYIRVPFQLTSVLDAVNTLIGSLGETAVTSADSDSGTDVTAALLALDQADLAVQTRGWHWNREYAFPLSLSTGGAVLLPANTLRVTQAYARATGTPIDVTQRGVALYDLTNHTYTFTTAPTVDLVLRLSWDLLPDVARRLITYEALDSFHAPLQASQIVLQVNAEDKKNALVALEQHEDEVAHLNSVYGNVSALTSLFGTGGLRRNRGGGW